MSKCHGYRHYPGCNCGYNPIYVDGRGNTSSLVHYSKAKQERTGNFISLMSHRCASSMNRGTNCKYCGKLVYYVEHNDGKVFFDELGWPWPIHDCMRLRGASARKRFQFGDIQLTAAQQPVLCRIKSWMKRGEHFFAKLETVESIPWDMYVKLMSRRIGIKRDAIVVLFQRNSICTLGNSRGEESQVQDCDKNWYETEFRKKSGNSKAVAFAELIAESAECSVVKRPKPFKSKPSSKEPDQWIFDAICTGRDATYFYFDLLQRQHRLKEKILVIRVAKNSVHTRKYAANFSGAVNEKATLQVGSISNQGICDAIFVKKG